MDRCRVGRLRQQSQSALLQADEKRPQTATGRDLALAQTGGSDRKGAGAGDGVRKPMRKQMRGSVDFSAEVEAHIRIEADRYRARGMSEEDALAAARRAFGNVTKTE